MNAFTDLAHIFMSITDNNPWRGTPVERYYGLNPASKGSKGEEIVSALLTEKGYQVLPGVNSGHNRMVNNIKTEIKIALATNRNTNFECIFNHIGLQKDWEQILFVCVNGDGQIKGTMFNKGNLPMELLNRQQGGKRSGNDDYMVNATHSAALLGHRQGTVLW